MAETESETEMDGEVGNGPVIVTAAVGILALIGVLLYGYSTAPFGAGIWYWFGMLVGGLVVGAVAAGIAWRIAQLTG